MTSQEALRLAEEKELDLVKISPNAVPPVCKLMDYGKIGSSRPSARRKPGKTSAWLRLKRSACPPALT